MQQVITALIRMQENDENYFGYATIVWDGLSPVHREQLNQLLHQGPVWDGNVISKSARDALIKFGLATRCCFMGEQGYTAATYKAFTVFNSGKGKPCQRKPGLKG